MQRPIALESDPSELKSGEATMADKRVCEVEGTFQWSPVGVSERSAPSESNKFPAAKVVEKEVVRRERSACDRCQNHVG